MDRPTLQITLERDRRAPSLARAAIAGFFEQSKLSQEGLAMLTLLVSEVVSNAVVHPDAGASEMVLRARQLGDGAIRVEVTDQGSGFIPVPRDPSQPNAGYGLYLLEKQATRWGVDQHGGTRVWFEIGAPAPRDGHQDGQIEREHPPVGGLALAL